jgi:hypothetical protein
MTKIRFVLLSSVLLAPCQAALAQSISVKVPFTFGIGDRSYCAGEYSLSSSREKVILQDAAGKVISMAMSNAASGRRVGDSGEVVFHCYENRCFLSELWIPTSDIGRQLLPSRAEIETAKTSTQTYFALLGSPREKK